jgi:hypothetical protein
MLYAFFWVIPLPLNFIRRRFGTLRLFHLHRRVGMKMAGVENFGVFIRENVWLPIVSGYFRAKHFSISLPQHFQPRSFFIPTCLWRWNRESVPKLRHINFTFMLPCIVIDFFLNNQPDAPIIQIYSVIKLYIFGSKIAIFEPNLCPYKYPNIFNPSHSSHLPACEDGTDRVYRNVGI